MADITVSNGNSNHVFRLRGTNLNANGQELAVRSDTNATLDLPHSFRISHQGIGKGDTTRRRSVYRFDRTVERSEDQVQGVISVYLVVDQPVKVATATQVGEAVQTAINFANATGNVVKIVNGELFVE